MKGIILVIVLAIAVPGCITMRLVNEPAARQLGGTLREHERAINAQANASNKLSSDLKSLHIEILKIQKAMRPTEGVLKITNTVQAVKAPVITPPPAKTEPTVKK